jgi:phage tail-like protein
MSTPNNQPQDPFRGFRFILTIDGLAAGGFSEVTLSDITVESITYREGRDQPFHRNLSGMTTYGRVSLRKGMTSSLDLYKWHDSIVENGTHAKNARRTVHISLQNSDSTLAAQWTVTGAWPSVYQTSGLNASAAEVMIETLELVIDRITRVK